MMNETERDLVFLFGAGASHGAGGILPEPPLGPQPLQQEVQNLCYQRAFALTLQRQP